MSRLEVLKTYKIYIGGQFPRTESGRYYSPLDKTGKSLGNICLSSRKDVRNAVVAARKAFGGWSERAAMNRGQILYRIAEMLEGRKAQFVAELTQQGLTKTQAEKEINISVDRIVYYAGWCDKYQAILSSVNPVASSHFNFSALEPMGVVGIIPTQESSLIGLISLVMPVICGGNTAVIIDSENLPLCAVTFAEVLNSSDLPGGVVNILTGTNAELNDTISTHMDVNAIAYGGNDSEALKKIQENAMLNVKRIFNYEKDWMNSESQDLYMISDTQEVKTTWHPIENIGGSSSSY
jgi:acyl-CoA reductase-like NAD-dependent aldehyde dehydrogenase